MAIEARKPAPGSLIHHSDRGMQYACSDYTDVLAAHDITASMSRIGNPYDNAKAERFMRTLKTEQVDGTLYRDRQQARAASAPSSSRSTTPGACTRPWAIDRRPSSKRAIFLCGRARAALRDRKAPRRPRPRTSLTLNLTASINDQPTVRCFAVSPMGCSPVWTDSRAKFLQGVSASSAGRRGANRPAEAFADALDMVEESDAPENGSGFPPFPVFPPVRVDARETCERWNMLRSSSCGMEGRRYAVS